MNRSRTCWRDCFVAASLLTVPAWAWSGNGAAPGTSGYVVDRSDRDDVVAFWHAVYQPSESYVARTTWSVNYTTPNPPAGAEGTLPRSFVDDVERRLNFIRALCGVPANCRVNSGATVAIYDSDPIKPDPAVTKAAASQRAAFMMIRTVPVNPNSALSHDPPRTNVGWTEAAWNASAKGNLCYGFYGPGAIDQYALDSIQGKIGSTSYWNTHVGHRRWLLALQATDYATGDTPGRMFVGNGDTATAPTNVFYVMPKTAELDGSVRARFVAYPADGFFPVKLNSPLWSLSYPLADFSRATVSMKNASGQSVPVQLVAPVVGYGENTLVWKPSGIPGTSVSQDTRYDVTVSGISGDGVPSSHSYSVTLIDPGRLAVPATVSGPATAPTTGADYAVASPSAGAMVKVGFAKPVSTDWNEGAEDSPAPRILSSVSPAYNLLSSVKATQPGYASNYMKTGAKAFRLTLPTAFDPLAGGAPDQWFAIDRDLLPEAGAALKFCYRRGYMTPGTRLIVESSSDGGVGWTPLGVEIKGNTNPDAAFISASYPVPASAVPLRFRFRLHYAEGSLYTHSKDPTYATGVFIDDITTSNCKWIEEKGAVDLPPSLRQVTFNPTTAGTALWGGQTWWIRARVNLGGYWFPYGPPQVVTTTGPQDPGSGGGGGGGGPVPTDPATLYAFDRLDADGSGALTHAEYSQMFAKLPKTGDTTFPKLDADASGTLGPAEWEAGKTNKLTLKTIPAFIQRAGTFMEIDTDGSKSLTLAEFSVLYPPGTKSATVSATWKRMGGTGSLTFLQFAKATALPSLANYAKAKTTRAERVRIFASLDADGNDLLTRTEFGRLFKPGTKAAQIDSAWLKATGTPARGTPPASLTEAGFVESPALPKLTVF